MAKAKTRATKMNVNGAQASSKNHEDPQLGNEIKNLLAELKIPSQDELMAQDKANSAKKKKKKDKKKAKNEQKQREPPVEDETYENLSSKDKQDKSKIKSKSKPKPKQETNRRVELESSSEEEEEEAEESASENDKDVEEKGQDGSNKHTYFEDSDGEEEEEEEDENMEEPNKEMETEGEVELWYMQELPFLEKLVDGKMRKDFGEIGKLRDRAEKLLAQEVENGREKFALDAEWKWMQKVVKSGTLSDQVASRALLISMSPIHNLKQLEILVQMSAKKGRREAHLAIDALSDLFVNNLLPSDRALVGFNARVEGLSRKGLEGVTDQHLLMWILEGEIKAKFLEFVRNLETWSFDTVLHSKRVAVSTALKLLQEKPEQEKLLLMMIVNKLGDTDKKLASHIVFLLNELLRIHPNMRPVVATEVEQFIFRPKTTSRAIYYSAIFLNQIVLQQEGDEELAQKLIAIYLRMFKVFFKEEGKEYGLQDITAPGKDKKKPMMMTKKQKKKAKKNQQQKFTGTGLSVEATKSKLLSAILTGINRAFPFAKSEGEVFNDQIDTLFEMVHVGNLGTAIQALMLLLHVMLARKAVSNRFYRALYALLLDPEVRTTSKQTMLLNILFRAMKNDPNLQRVRAFVKRLLQIGALAAPGFAAASLIVVASVLMEKPILRRNLPEMETTTTKEKKKDDSEDEDESDDDDADEIEQNLPKVMLEAPEEENEEKTVEEEHADDTDVANVDYDPTKRDPMYAHTGPNAKFHELGVFLSHHHPSVRTFAENIVQRKPVRYDGNPLKDFALGAFLDRFVYKKPRQRDIDNLKNKDQVFGHKGRLSRKGKTAVTMPVTSANFLLQDESRVDASDKFFYEYFHRKANNEGKNLRTEIASKGFDTELNGEEAFLNDDEAAIDEYADALAQKLLEDKHGPADIDDDDAIDFDYSSDEEEKKKKKKDKPMSESEMFDGFSSGSEDESDGEILSDIDDDDLSSIDDDEDDDEMGDFSDNKRKRDIDAFADADEFAALLESAGKKNKREQAWEDKATSKFVGGKSKKFKRARR